MNQPINNNNTTATNTYPFFVTGYSAAQQPLPDSPPFNQHTFSHDSNNSPDLTVNDWLNQLMVNPELIATKPEQQQQQSTTDFGDLFQFLPISPPLTTSPDSVHQEMMPSSNIGTPNMNNTNVTSTDALVALFPDILNTNLPPPRPVTAQRKPPVAIMPKAAHVPIAPRPGGFTPPLSSAMKRKSDASGLDSDEAAQKRQKNTDAARRSRLKKIIKMETLEKQVTELESDNARLTTRVAVLESEKSALVTKDKGLEERIRVLEAQLAEAHRALTVTATVNATQGTTTTTTTPITTTTTSTEQNTEISESS